MYKFNNSTLSFEEWIRLNDIDTPQILEAADIIAEQESIITEQEQEIYNLKSFDFETMEKLLDNINIGLNPTENLLGIWSIMDNYKLRIKDI